METIGKQYLAGLTFRTSKPVKGEEGKITHQAQERELLPEDVLSWKDQGETVIIVTADGSKHRVNKKEAEAAAKKALAEEKKTDGGNK